MSTTVIIIIVICLILCIPFFIMSSVFCIPACSAAGVSGGTVSASENMLECGEGIFADFTGIFESWS